MTKVSVLLASILAMSSAAYAQDGGSCANAIPVKDNGVVQVNTAAGTGWINNYGPLVSPSNDIVYTFTTTQANLSGTITATASDYAFAIYVLTSCAAGAGPTPFAATATLNAPISLSLQPTTQYWIAVTGTAGGGAGANGTVAMDVNFIIPVTLQAFYVE